MTNEIHDLHSLTYDLEREKRWGMAKENEQPSAEKIVSFLSNLFGTDCEIKIQRYDEIWFEKFDPTLTENEWVKGVPDYVIIIKCGEYVFFSYLEIKLKCQEFRKTIIGGLTRSGSQISNYGCTSYYLDIVPVWTNMNSFCNKTGLKPSNLNIAFVNEDFSEIRIITLDQVNQMVDRGWNELPLCQYGEGYGKKAYLIPKYATQMITEIRKEQYLQSRKVILPNNLKK